MTDTRDEIINLLLTMAGGEVLEVGGAGEYHIVECLDVDGGADCFQVDNGDCLTLEAAADRMFEIGGVWDYVEIPDEDDDDDFHDPDSFDLDDEAFGDGSPLDSEPDDWEGYPLD